MKILIGILAHQLDSEVVRRVHTQAWDDPDGYDVLTCWGADIRPDEDRFAAITRKYAALQRMFLSGPWDCLLTVEQDMLLPENTLTRLSRLVKDGADIAYGAYIWRYEGYHWLNLQPRLRVDEETAYFWSLTHQADEARRIWGQPVVVEGLGLGCTLITRSTLVRIPFRRDKKQHSCDTPFAIDARHEGLTQIGDLGVICGHKIDAQHTVWPDPEQPELYRIDELTLDQTARNLQRQLARVNRARRAELYKQSAQAKRAVALNHTN